jgi:hypothetical protein
LWTWPPGKGKAYSCEALYLDPGWDTDFGTFIWGEDWLGPRKQFIEDMESKFGLKVSLHCPLATWMSYPNTWGKDAWKGFPSAALRTPLKPGEGTGDEPPGAHVMCLGSKQYLAVA